MILTTNKPGLPGPRFIRLKTHLDARGSFTEVFNLREFQHLTGTECTFVQDNVSVSNKNVIRGLHYQSQHPQGKLVRVSQGKILDVCVDLRVSSPSYGKWLSVFLSDDGGEQFWIPPGFAHGFLTLSDRATVNYKVTDYRYPEYERTLKWNDPDLRIAWPPITKPVLSLKDAAGDSWADTEGYL